MSKHRYDSISVHYDSQHPEVKMLVDKIEQHKHRRCISLYNMYQQFYPAGGSKKHAEVAAAKLVALNKVLAVLNEIEERVM